MGQIGDPQPVRRVGGEVPLDEVGRPCGLGVRPSGAHPFFPLDAPDIEQAHQAGDLVAADVVTGSPGGDPAA